MGALETVRLGVRVHPGGRRCEVLRFQEGIWHIRVASPPVEGRANAELVRYLAGLLNISKTSITIERGHTGRNKLVRITGLTAGQVADRMARGLAEGS